MNKIKEIETLQRKWEAIEEESQEHGEFGSHTYPAGVSNGLTMALEILKRPSNTQMQIDAKACVHNHDKLRENWTFTNCPGCGQPLHD